MTKRGANPRGENKPPGCYVIVSTVGGERVRAFVPELDAAPGAPLDDVAEVSNYVAALDHGLR